MGLPLQENLILKTMKKQILSFLFITVLSFGFGQDFNIKSEESVIEFNYVSEQAVGTIKGVTGKIHFDLNNLSNSYFETKADISSINTSNKTRDKHLNAPDYFHTEKYPYLTFKSESLNINGNEFVLIGNFSIKEISKKKKSDLLIKTMFLKEDVLFTPMIMKLKNKKLEKKVKNSSKN